MTDVHTGAQALRDLLAGISALSDAGCDDIDDSPPDAMSDMRDYRAMVEAVELSIARNLHDCGAAHREGYLRSLASLLCLVADGCGLSAEWDPVAETEASFAAPRTAEALIRRAAQ